MYDCATMTRPALLIAILLVASGPGANAQLREGERQLGEDAVKAIEKKFSELEKWLNTASSKPAPELHVKPAPGVEKQSIRIIGDKADSPEPPRKLVVEERKPPEEQDDIKEQIQRCTSQVIFKAPFETAARTGLGTAIVAYHNDESVSQIVYAAESAAFERFKKEVDTTLTSPQLRAVEVLKCVLPNGVDTPVRDAVKHCAKTATLNGQISQQALHCFTQALLK